MFDKLYFDELEERLVVVSGDMMYLSLLTLQVIYHCFFYLVDVFALIFLIIFPNVLYV